MFTISARWHPSRPPTPLIPSATCDRFVLTVTRLFIDEIRPTQSKNCGRSCACETRTAVGWSNEVLQPTSREGCSMRLPSPESAARG